MAEGEPVAEIVAVTGEEAFSLDKIDEHQAIEHDGGIPIAVGPIGDALDEAEEVLPVGIEVLVELLGDLLDVEGGAGATGDGERG